MKLKKILCIIKSFVLKNKNFCISIFNNIKSDSSYLFHCKLEPDLTQTIIFFNTANCYIITSFFYFILSQSIS